MGFSVLGMDDRQAMKRVLVTVISEVFLVVASVLVFFVQLSLPASSAGAAALFTFFIGTLLAWQKYRNAVIILFLSMLATEVVIIGYSMDLLIPFILFDLLAAAISMRSLYQDQE
jgi:hypothetical protein